MSERSTSYPWQQSQWSNCVASLRQDRLPHAYLLAGPEGIAKVDFALSLAALLLCESRTMDSSQACGKCAGCALVASEDAHPDFYQIDPQGKSQSISVDQIRSLMSKLVQSSTRGGYRVILISSADAMTTAASNALLKILEEPGPETLFLLVSHASEGVLPTVRSRCQALVFSMPRESMAIQYLMEAYDYDESGAEQVLAYCEGAPLAVRRLLDDGAEVSEICALYGQFAELMLAVLKRELDCVKAAEMSQVVPVMKWLSLMQRVVISIVRHQSGADVHALNASLGLVEALSRCSKPDLMSLYTSLQQCRDILRRSNSANELLLRERIMIEWSRMLS